MHTPEQFTRARIADERQQRRKKARRKERLIGYIRAVKGRGKHGDGTCGGEGRWGEKDRE